MKISIILAAMTGSFETDMNRASKTAQKRMKEIEKNARQVGKVVGAALVATATAATVAVKAAIDRADELSKTAQKIGVTTEALSALSYAADLADVELGELQGGLAKLTKFQSEAAQGAEKNVALFKALGIEFRNIDGTLRSTDDVFRDVAERFQSMPDGATKTALALDLFGRSGANLIPLLNGGAEGLEAMREEAEKLGIIIDTETGKAAEEFNDNLSRIKLSVVGLASQVAKEMLPTLQALTAEFVDTSTEGGKVSETAVMIADAFKGTIEFGIKFFNVLKLMTLGAVGFYAKVGELQQKFTLARFMPGAEGRAQSFADVAAVSFAGAEEAFNRASFSPTPAAEALAGSSGGSPNGRGRGVKVDIDETSDALAKYYERANAATAATDALNASREAQREAEKAAADLEKREADAMEKLAEQRAEQYDELHEIRERERADLAAAKKLVDDTLADIAFETSLIGLNNLEREKAIALRYANVEAASAEGQAIAGALERLDEAARGAEGIEFAKGEMKSLLVDLADGFGSASDAVDDFFDNLKIRALQALADGLIEKLFSGAGTNSASGGGSAFADIFGALFGGARAAGGPTVAGKAYIVGEDGPELHIPSVSGTVIPARQTQQMLIGQRGGMTVNVLGATSRRSLDRLRVERERDMRRASGEFA